VRRVPQIAEDVTSSLSLGEDALFLVWGPPSHGPRSRVFARELQIPIRFVTWTRRRGLLVAPFKYAVQGAKTARLLWAARPRVVLVQSPPTFAAMAAWLYAAITRTHFVVDAHSAAMMSPYWTRPRWLYRRMARRALATVVTNEQFARRVRGMGGRAIVIPDIPTTFPTGERYPVEGAFNVMVVSSFAPDEPLSEIVAAARDLREISFHVTGDPNRDGAEVPPDLPPNVRLTGFLPDATYHALMSSCQAVLCLTTRNHTMQRGACEALWTGRPIVTSDWPLLREYFSAAAVHVDNTAGGIREGVREVLRDHARYQEEIVRLQAERRRSWRAAVDSLIELLERPPRARARGPERAKDR